MSRTTRGRIFRRKINGRLSSNYYLQYYVDGVERKVSLGTGNMREAEKRRDEILRPLQLSDRTQRLREVYHVLKTTEEDGETLELARKGAIQLDHVWEIVRGHKEFRNTRERTLDGYGKQWTAFVKWVERYHPKTRTLAQVTPEIAAGYMRSKQDRNKGTQNKIIRICSKVFRLAYGASEKHHNPFSDIGTYATSKVKQERHRPLTWDKAMEICDNAPDEEMRLLFFIGLFTGQRLGDCVLLSWSEVDLMRNLIMLTQRKTGREITIPIHSSLRTLLESIPPTERKGYVIPGLADLYLNKHPSRLTRKIKAVFASCGINPYKEGTGPGTGKRAVVLYSFHSLRHTFNTRLRENGIGNAVIQALTGHSSDSMTDRYTAIGGEVIQRAIEALPAAVEDDDTRTERERLKKLIDAMPIEQVREGLKRIRETEQ